MIEHEAELTPERFGWGFLAPIIDFRSPSLWAGVAVKSTLGEGPLILALLKLAPLSTTAEPFEKFMWLLLSFNFSNFSSIVFDDVESSSKKSNSLGLSSDLSVDVDSKWSWK